MEIRQLRAFVAISEAGTFTAGAKRVHVTQAAISMQIRQLENELRARLCSRKLANIYFIERGTYFVNMTRLRMRLPNLLAPSEAGYGSAVPRPRF
jgi:DNA-binding transcriptional LysR family regulator